MNVLVEYLPLSYVSLGLMLNCYTISSFEMSSPLAFIL